MIKYLVCAAFCLMASCANAQDLYYNYGGNPYCPPQQLNVYRYDYYQPRVVGYYPIVQWIPQGTYFNVGPAIVTPDRRRVILGINTGFYSINGVDTYYIYGR